MATLYRIADKATGTVVGDFIIESTDAVLMSSTHELVLTENLPLALPDLKQFYINEINKKTSEVRARFLTLEVGQETTYAAKTEEAIAYIQDPAPVDTNYPYLNNEATATGTTVADLASVVLTKAQAMKTENVVIEAQRKRGVKQVNDAIDEAEAKGARDFAFDSLDAHVPV